MLPADSAQKPSPLWRLNDKPGTRNADVTDAGLLAGPGKLRSPSHSYDSHKLTASHADNHLFHLPIVSDRFRCALDGQPVLGCLWILPIIAFVAVDLWAICFCPFTLFEVWTCPSRRCRRSLIQVTIIDKGSSPFIWQTVFQWYSYWAYAIQTRLSVP